MSVEDQLKANFSNSKNQEPAVIRSADDITSAFYDIDVKESPSRGKYFPSGTMVKIKSLDVFDIKNYSKMDASVNSSVESHIDRAMEKNIKVVFPDGNLGSFNDMTQFDRIHYLFLLRDATMRNFKSKKELYQIVKNPADQSEEKKIIIDHNIFEYYTIPNGVEKWYDEILRCYRIYDDSSMPVIDLSIHMPTVGTINWIKNHIRELEIRKHGGEEIFYDENFYKYLQFLVKDWRDLDAEYVKSKQEWFDNLSLEENDILIGAIDKITIGIKPNVKVMFGDKEVTVPVRFREYKSIFSISDRSSVLLSDTE